MEYNSSENHVFVSININPSSKYFEINTSVDLNHFY